MVTAKYNTIQNTNGRALPTSLSSDHGGPACFIFKGGKMRTEQDCKLYQNGQNCCSCVNSSDCDLWRHSIARTIKGFRNDIRVQDTESYSDRNRAAVRVYAWNWATCPSRPMTDKEHSACSRFARQIWRQLHLSIFNVMWHESDSGRLWI